MSKIDRYADIKGIDRAEVRQWVNAYIKRPGEFPELVKHGLIEDTVEARKQSIQAYIESEIANSVTGRVIALNEAQRIKEAA